jgi:hypothetical protein
VADRTEFFFAEERAPAVIVFVHIPKTAGTALRRCVRSNLAAERDVVQNIRSVADTPAEKIAWFREWYRSLEEDRRDRLSCVMSHEAGYLLPALDRDVDALTLVREPVDRTLSYYFFKQRQFEPRKQPEWSLDSLEGLAEKRSSPGWRQRAAREGKVLDQLFNNWQSRALLSIYHDASTLDAGVDSSAERDLWRQRLRDLVDEVFLVGVQDRFQQYTALLARRYGWQKVRVRHAKVNPQRPAGATVSPELRAAILDYNWLDRELYELSRQAQLAAESATTGLVRRSA